MVLNPAGPAHGDDSGNGSPAPSLAASPATPGASTNVDAGEREIPAAEEIQAIIHLRTNVSSRVTSTALVPGRVDVSAGNRTIIATADVISTHKVISVHFHLRQTSQETPPMLQARGVLISGTTFGGQWETAVVVPRGLPPGRWPLTVVVQAEAVPPVCFGPFCPASLPPGSATELEVVNRGEIDRLAPEVEILQVEPRLAFVGCGNVATPVKIRLRVRSASGLGDDDTSWVQLVQPTRSITIEGDPLSGANRISGDEFDGIYEAAGRVFPNVEVGDFLATAIARSRLGRTARPSRPGPLISVRSLLDLPAGYTQWATKCFPGRFPDPECRFHPTWRPDADPDGDRVLNIVEAYFGTSPTDPEQIPKVSVSYDSKRQFVLHWTQPANVHGLVAQPEWSPNLDLWLASGEAHAESAARSITVVDDGPAPGGGIFKEARFEMDGLPHAYLRLRVVMP